MRDSAAGPAMDQPGAYLTRVTLSIGTLDLLRFVRYDHAFPRHSHQEFTVGAFESGNGSLGYRRANWQAFDGSVLAVPPDEVHTAEPSSASGWTYRAMYPSAALMSLALGQTTASDVPAYFAQPIFDDAALARLLSFVHRLLEAGNTTLEAEALLITGLQRLVSTHGVSAPAAPCDTPVARLVTTARDYLRDNYSKTIKLAALAAACNASPFHLVRSFTAVVGMPPHAFLTQIRANRARDLLVRGESLAGVAYSCGFCDQSHLTRTFKRIFGVTPGVYLNSLQPVFRH